MVAYEEVTEALRGFHKKHVGWEELVSTAWWRGEAV